MRKRQVKFTTFKTYIKQALMVIIAMALIFSFAVLPASAETYANDNDSKATDLLIGDANCDGEITLIDAIIIQRASISICKLDGQAFKNADVDGDGKISLRDAILVQSMALKTEA